MPTEWKPLSNPSAHKGKRKGNKKSASEIQNNLNIKNGEDKKKPLDLEESRVNLVAEDEGFDLISERLGLALAGGTHLRRI